MYGVTERLLFIQIVDCSGRDGMLRINFFLNIYNYLIFYFITFVNIKFAQCLDRVSEEPKRERDYRVLPIGK